MIRPCQSSFLISITKTTAPTTFLVFLAPYFNVIYHIKFWDKVARKRLLLFHKIERSFNNPLSDYQSSFGFFVFSCTSWRKVIFNKYVVLTWRGSNVKVSMSYDVDYHCHMRHDGLCKYHLNHHFESTMTNPFPLY